MQKKQTIHNTFWKDVVYSVYYVYTNSTIRSLEHVLAMPIWYSTKIITVKMQSWVDKGIQTIGDMLDTEGHIYSLEYFKNILHLKNIQSIEKKIQITIGNNQISPQDNLRPRLPFILYNIQIGTKGYKNIYSYLQTKGNNTLVELQNKWSEKMNDNIMLDTISNAFKNAKKYSPTVYQHFTQFKLLHRRIGNNRLLHKMNITETPCCLFCN